MQLIGRRIYFDKSTGLMLVDTGDIMTHDDYVTPTIEQDFKRYAVLAERVPDSVGVLELEYGQYAQDFAECNGYRVNPETQELEFSYPDPNNPEAPPVYQEPLSEQVGELKQAVAELTMLVAMSTQ